MTPGEKATFKRLAEAARRLLEIQRSTKDARKEALHAK